MRQAAELPRFLARGALSSVPHHLASLAYEQLWGAGIPQRARARREDSRMDRPRLPDRRGRGVWLTTRAAKRGSCLEHQAGPTSKNSKPGEPASSRTANPPRMRTHRWWTPKNDHVL